MNPLPPHGRKRLFIDLTTPDDKPADNKRRRTEPDHTASNGPPDASHQDYSLTPTPFTPPRSHQCYFLSRNPGGKSGYVPDPTLSPNTKALMEEEMGPPLTAKFDDNGSPYKASTPGGTKLKRSMKTSLVNTYALAANSPHRCDYAKAVAKTDKLSLTPPFAPLTRFSGMIILDEDRLEEFMGIRKGWRPTQGEAMGMSAKDAAIAAGVDVEGQFHWLHLFAFSMGGADGEQPNEEQNLILGTAAANGHHLRVEDTIKNLVTEHRQIYVRYYIDPDQEVFDADWHVCGHFTYEFGLVNEEFVDDYHVGEVGEDQVRGKFLDSVTIDTLNTSYSHSSDQPLIQAASLARLQRFHGYGNAESLTPTLVKC